MLRVFWKLVAGAMLSLSLMVGSAHALGVQQIGTFDEPIYLTSDPGNAERLFVVERGGTILELANGQLRPFANVSSKVSCCEGERGLLSIALAPDFDSSGRFYLYYTGTEEPGEIHLSEMVASGSGAPLSTLRDVIEPIPHSARANHDGGQVQVGPEGNLFIGTGDGGGEKDELHNAQNPASLLGKLLRVTPVPGVTVAPTVWSLGLRNPFRFSFDRSTGDLWIGDVGQGAREEVDLAAAPGLGENANYGWNCMEGGLSGPPPPYEDPQCIENSGKFTSPVFDYPHSVPANGGAHGCAIIGGYVARGPNMGSLTGRYLYGDLCEGDIRSFSPLSPVLTDRSEGLHIGNLNSFGQDSCGRLYAISGSGPVFRLVGPEGNGSCSPAAPIYQPAASPSYVAIRAVSRKVKRHRRGLITTWVTPCPGRRGDPVTLWRGRRRLGTRYLDRACSAHFRPRIDRRSSFRTTVKGDSSYLSAISRKLTLKPKRRHR